MRESHSVAFYESVRSDPAQKIFVADAGNDLRGYIVLKPNTLPCDPPIADALELSRLYIHQSHQSKGIGHRLMEKGLEYATIQKASHVTLSVFSENLGAQKFYQRYGFFKIGDHEFIVGEHKDADFIYAKPLD